MYRSLSAVRRLPALRAARCFSMSESKSAKSVLIPIANGTEEMEAVVVIDVLRRAGMSVTVASVEDTLKVVASRQTKIEADELITATKNKQFDAIFLPGGMPGAERLRDSATLTNMLKQHVKSGKLFGAICAAPAVVLEHHGLLTGRTATCHAGFRNKLKTPSNDRVVVSKNCITSQAPGTAFEWSLEIVHALCGADAAKKVAEPMAVNFAVSSTTSKL